MTPINEETRRALLTEARPEWAIVTVMPHYQRADLRLLEQYSGAYGADVRIVIVTPDAATAEFLRAAYMKSFTVIHMAGGESSFSWAAAAGTGAAACRAAKRFLFVRDDVYFDGSVSAALASLAVAVDAPGNGIAVPLVMGEKRCHNPAQSCLGHRASWEHLRYFDMSEFADESVIAVAAGPYWGVGGFDSWLDGDDWAQIDLQKKLADGGRGTVVVPRVTVSRTDTPDTVKTDPAAYRRNLLRFCARHSIHCDRDARPSLPRLPALAQGAQRPAKSLCVLVDGADDIDRLKAMVAASEGVGELVVVDRSPSAAMQEYVHGVVGASGRGRYAPAWSWVPRNQVINLAGGVAAEFVDLRDSAAPVVGPRLRAGNRYTLPQFETQFHIGMLEGCGLGDTLMMTAAVHALKVAHPHLSITVHHGWDAGRVLQHNPDIAEVVIHEGGTNHTLPPETTQFVGIGGEGTLRRHFDSLSIGHLAADPEMRRVRYAIQPDEHDAAAAFMADSGVTADGYIVGVQLSGGWLVKSWAHTRALIDRLLLDDSARVVVFAGGGADTSDMPTEHPNLILCTGQPIRTAIAVLGICDAFVGFDSGLAFAAGAIGTPTVTLWGGHDPRGVLLDTDPLNARALRRRTPLQCYEEFGNDCRGNSGSQCPLRGPGARGGQCLDEISVEDVMAALADLPRWGRPIADRAGAH